ncbi:3'(2'),5'-bisphosphate nucleotidase CysQ [Commensalibacter sp. Nvir]|uniref:3'(2'),5'-bisphosphate nucleotidase CysQ n=1 Tax=Commensalibacter sp. Nvir TaxID=3069817 RepID=UPI002D4FE2A4|nr:3'(2'),5'-bisphosphate nucleotidase CysQ [Commensalibacter sp. Nvir]
MHLKSQELIEITTNLAIKASKIINEIRKNNFQIELKEDLSPVTEADHASEKIILTGLRKYYPDIPIVSEEEFASGFTPTFKDKFWLVDPLDGTKEFIKGSNHFTVNIGLIQYGKPVLGVVALPAYNIVYCGIQGENAWKIDENGNKIPIHVSPVPPAQGLRIMVSHSFKHQHTLQEILTPLSLSSIEHMGSAAKIMRIAEGKADLHIRLNSIMEWDTAAPQAVLEAAGGTLCTFDRNPLTYGKKNWRNQQFVCLGSPILLDLPLFKISNL